MKKLITLILLFVSIHIFAQNFSKIASIELKAKEDYKKAEPDVKECAYFLFRTPNKPHTGNRKLAMAFIVKWMSGTPDQTFNIDSKAIDLTKGNQGLFAMYMIALTKISLDNPDEKLSNNDYFEKASKILADYCSKKENKLKPSRALKKVIKKMKKD